MMLALDRGNRTGHPTGETTAGILVSWVVSIYWDSKNKILGNTSKSHCS